MCGIIGGLNLTSTGFGYYDTKILQQLLIVDSIRGMDSTGLAWQDKKDKVWFRKNTDSGGAFVEQLDTLADGIEGARWAIGHNRAATIGSVTNDTAHPFSYGTVTGVHNGTISNFRSLWPDSVEETDSMTLYNALSKIEPDDEAVTDFLAGIGGGAYALVWYDSRINSLRFARNRQRPLHFMKESDGWYWASEKPMLSWLLGRADFMRTNSAAWSLKPMTLMTVPVDGEAATHSTYTATFQNTYPTTYQHSHRTPASHTAPTNLSRYQPSPYEHESAFMSLHRETFSMAEAEYEVIDLKKRSYYSIPSNDSLKRLENSLSNEAASNLLIQVGNTLSIDAANIPITQNSFQDRLIKALCTRDKSPARRYVTMKVMHVTPEGWGYGAVNLGGTDWPCKSYVGKSTGHARSILGALKNKLWPECILTPAAIEVYPSGELGISGHITSVARSSRQALTNSEIMAGAEDYHPELMHDAQPDLIDWDNNWAYTYTS
jgi:hypothetical protein